MPKKEETIEEYLQRKQDEQREKFLEELKKKVLKEVEKLKEEKEGEDQQ